MSDLVEPVRVRGMTTKTQYRGTCPDCGLTTTNYATRATAAYMIAHHQTTGRCPKRRTP